MSKPPCFIVTHGGDFMYLWHVCIYDLCPMRKVKVTPCTQTNRLYNKIQVTLRKIANAFHALIHGWPTVPASPIQNCNKLISHFWFVNWIDLGQLNAAFILAHRLLLCRFTMQTSLAVSWLTLSGVAAMAHRRVASLPSWIDVNYMWSAAVGKAARLSIY